MRSVGRPRRYVARFWLVVFRPFLRYSVTRDAFVLRVVGRSIGPDRRSSRRRASFDGVERRRVSAT
jgi:hypothetical protein